MEDSAIRRLAIQFDRSNATYRTGEFVSGNILTEFVRPKRITGLQVFVSGESMVRWFAKKHPPDPDSEYQPGPAIPCEAATGREEYFSWKFHLLGGDSGSPLVVSAGSMAHPFRFQLPVEIPCSFEHENAYARYTIKAIFDSPWERSREVKSGFTVISPYDLNRRSGASLDIREDIVKDFFCSCVCPTGKIYARFSVPSTGFVPGQVLPVTVQCENESTVDVTRIKVTLRRNLKFHAKSPKRKVRSDEAIVARTGVSRPFADNSEERVTMRLKVPPLPPTGLEYCALIDVDYALRIVMCFSGTHFSVKRRFPILIGTVPLIDSVDACRPGGETRPFGKTESLSVRGSAANPFAPRYPVNDSIPSVQSLILP